MLVEKPPKNSLNQSKVVSWSPILGKMVKLVYFDGSERVLGTFQLGNQINTSLNNQMNHPKARREQQITVGCFRLFKQSDFNTFFKTSNYEGQKYENCFK